MTGLAEFCITTLKSQFRGISNLITIDRRASKPLYQQIYDSFRSRIIRGDLRAGDLVPSSRELARESRISRLPVLTAYAQLLAEGYFESRVGAGTFISSSLPSRSTGSLPSAARGQRLLSAQVAALPKYERPSWAESLGPFQVGQPELQKFPIEIWLRLVARYSRRMRLKALQYADAMGLPELRETIEGVDYRGRLRQRVPIWQPANCFPPGTRSQCSRYLHRHLQQSDVSIAATGIPGDSS